GNPVAGAAEAFAIAREAGLGVVPHAGELAGPEEVRSALGLGVDRIQHGVRAVEDPRVVEELAASGVCLDVCPSSNVILGVYPTLAEHPLPTLLDAGVRCSIGADDPLLFGVDVVDEYVLAHEQMGIPEAGLAGCARASIDSSFAPADLKLDALARVDSWEREAGQLPG
ncbi:adenosine deaminase family protein, partial [Dietzia sp. DQ12-76]|uniref:adenosine deaminase family protein n=1 Tax=Dietzia sp. DQ12-76 TaxID=1630639 RepID=UPI0035CD2BF6|nr:adenosine deaminase [Dietzia sp. DQ12-76]